MPNWCNNTLTLEHDNPTMVARARSAFLEGALLQQFFPCPADLDIVAGSLGHNTPEQLELEAKEEANLAKYGYKNWYDWKIANWGTKWDVGGGDSYVEDIEGGVMLTFDSAWSPPIGAYEKLLEAGFRVYATYYEPGCAFAGIWDNGSDEYYEYSGMDSKEIAEALPAELDEAYGISDSAAEWEAEQAEEE